MADLPTGRAIDQRKLFSEAEDNNTGFLGTDFTDISQGDLVFNATAKHVMIATGQTKEVKGKIQIEVIHAPSTGKYVETTWVEVKEGWTYGHTFRTTDGTSENSENNPMPTTGDQYNSSISAAPAPTFGERLGNRLLESKAPIVQDIGRLIKYIRTAINK